MIEGQGPSIAVWQHAAALGLVIVDIIARGARSTSLLPVTLTRAMVVNCAGDALAAVTPSRSGGDPVRYVWFTRSGVSGPVVLASFATETVANTVILVAGAVVLLFFFTGAIWSLIRDGAVSASSEDNLRIVAAVFGVGLVLTYAVARRFPRLGSRLLAFFAESWRAFRATPRWAVLRAGAWSVVSMVARFAILPVLLASLPAIGAGPLLLGSTLTLYALLLAPTPGGVGPIEAGFFAGFHDRMDVGGIGALLIAWRAYAWICSAAVGALLLLWERMTRNRGVGA